MKDRNGTTLGFGSGFFVRENLIATNYHVIEGASQGTAKLVGKYTTYIIEGVTATDETNDLTLLKVTAYGIKPLPLGMSSDVKIGETVYVAGNPKGLEGTFSDGIISSKQGGYSNERLQMTAPISPGSSGGPVLNRKGEVIGVSVSDHSSLDTQSLNFVIPSNYLKKLLDPSRIAKPLQRISHSISAETYFKWGNVKYMLGDYNGAIADYTEVIHLNSDYGNAYYNRGSAKRRLGQHFAAISDYDIVIQLNPDNANAYVLRGISKLQLGQHFAAISDYDIAIQLKPDNADTYVLRGIAKSDLGQHFAAISDYDIAIRLKPDNADAYLWRGISKSQLGQHFAAISDYDTAIQLKPDNAMVYSVRGLAKLKLKQFEKAITDYNTAIQLKPDNANDYFKRGVAKGALGCMQEAKQDLLTALKLAEKAGDASLKANIEQLLRNIN